MTRARRRPVRFATHFPGYKPAPRLAHIRRIEHFSRPSHIHRESNVNTNAPALCAKSRICIAAAAACAVLSVAAQAEELIFMVQATVATAGLDLSQPADARELYTRLSKAAGTVCSDRSRVDALPVADFASCYQKALGDAVRSANRTQLTLVYLQTHTLQDAANRGIGVPTLVVAK
jgi:UrcA family protein